MHVVLVFYLSLFGGFCKESKELKVCSTRQFEHSFGDVYWYKLWFGSPEIHECVSIQT